MIQVKNLNKAYGNTQVVDQVSFNLPASGVTSIIGPNGAGKSTLLSLMSRLQKPDSGSIQLDHLDVHHCDDRELARYLAILKQENQIATRLSVRDLVSFGRFPHSRGRLNQEDQKKIEESLSFLGLSELSSRYLDELSGGQRQRAYIAMVLCQDTRYLLLDEPLNNLDMQHAVSIMQLLRRAADQMGKVVLLVLHDINFASFYSDQILAMKAGKLAYQGPVEAILTPEIMQDLYQLEMTIQTQKGKPFAYYYG